MISKFLLLLTAGDRTVVFHL